MGGRRFANVSLNKRKASRRPPGAAAWTVGRSKPNDGSQLVVYAASFPVPAVGDDVSKIGLPLVLLEDVK
jgi:hypothetical protein